MKHPEPRTRPGYSLSGYHRFGQVADIEKKDGYGARPPASALVDYAESGFYTFDMADHYGSANWIARTCPSKDAGT
ncbi:MAG: hypothetical protein CM15mP45_16500 [Deltaproteobacteria bacterium]|nr:MAG: hypothetical protein CM15mP45_16500 [Deltaproteobacteria bacterium]